MTFKRRLITQALHKLLEDSTSWHWGNLRPPIDPSGKVEDSPYGIIIPREKGQLTGPPFSNNPWSIGSMEYTIRSFGLRHDQAELMADRAREVIIGRNSIGQYTYPLEIGEGHVVMERRPGRYSPGETRARGTMFEVDDAYVIVVTTS